MEQLIAFLLRASRWLTRRLVTVQREIEARRSQAAQSQTVVRSTVAHDMARHPDEDYYRRQYRHWITRTLDMAEIPADAKALDLGCGQGRLTLDLARRLTAGSAYGVDLSAPAIEQARRYAREENVGNVVYQCAAIADVVRESATATYDVIIMTEVSFYYPAWRSDLEFIVRALRPGGVLVAAFRPLYYDALMLVKAGLFENIEMLLEKREGPLFGGNLVHTWQTAMEIRQLFTDEIKMELLELAAIGCCSGLADDPHASFARPSELDEYAQGQLMRLETTLGPLVPDSGRYLLAAARKR
jgi:2-polyprenyl-3-methyl-5-hydroxy-6-metoxy-1,4-benzoquinol methylase